MNLKKKKKKKNIDGKILDKKRDRNLFFLKKKIVNFFI